MKQLLLFILLFASFSLSSFAQVGISVKDSRIYFTAGKGASDTKKIQVRNPNDRELEIGLSFGDWKYDSLGQNQLFDANTLDNSCTDWIKIQSSSYFTLKPHEVKDIEIMLTVPKDEDTSIRLHTGMIYLTQLNPDEGFDTKGAALNVTVRLAVKLFHSFSGTQTKDLDILDFTDFKRNAEDTKADALQIIVHNTGESWIKGSVAIELTNLSTGKSSAIPSSGFYSLPGDHTYITQNLPKELASGKYNAIALIHYGDKSDLKVAELAFEIDEDK